MLLAAVTCAATAGLGTGLSGCEAGPTAPTSPTATPIDPLTPVLIGQQELLASYELMLAAFPELAVALSDLQAQTTAHTEALLEAAPAAAVQVAEAGSGSSSIPASTLPVRSPDPPVDVGTAVSVLAGAVDRAAGDLRSAALRADGDLAALLGSCAASAACHARLLEL